MKSGREEYDQSLLDSLSKKYQIFLDSPNGEINVYLVLNKHEEPENSTLRPVSAFRNSYTTASSNVSDFNHRARSSLGSVLQQNNSYKNLQKSKNF